MTKSELLEMARKLQAQAESMPDEDGDSATTTDAHNSNDNPNDKTTTAENNNNDNGQGEPENTDAPNGVTEENELEEAKQIEPQTNGKITDKVVPGVDTGFEQSTTATETDGVEQVLAANFDQRFATILTQYTELKMEMDKMKVALSEIMTRIELVQEVTDKVTTVDHDTLLTESIKLLI